MTTRENLSPEEVAALSDEELSVRVAQSVFRAATVGESERAPDRWWYDDWDGRAVLSPPHRTGGVVYLNPGNPVAVEHVREHVRERWEREGRKGSWLLEYFAGCRKWAAYYFEAEQWTGGEERWRAESPTLGRAIFESSLLSTQESCNA